MNQDEAKIFAAQIGANIPELDLHGLFPSEAVEKLEGFLYNNYLKKKSIVKIIYGVGTGKLKNEILSYLSGHPLIKKLTEEDGHCLVILNC
jgi:DNA-nicking Smr family endonuclease